MAHTYRRCYNKANNPVVTEIFFDYDTPKHKIISDTHDFTWTKGAKAQENTNRRAKDKAIIHKVLNDIEFAEEAIFYTIKHYDDGDL